MNHLHDKHGEPRIAIAPEPPDLSEWREPPRRSNPVGRIFFGFLLPVFLVAAAALLAKRLIDTGPTAERRPPERRARLVEVWEAESSADHAVVTAMGTVLSARTVAIQPRVGGEIVEVNPELIPGGLLKRGDTLIKIDPADYEIAVRQREADLLRAQSACDVEKGQQTVSKREFELLGGSIEEADQDLILRKPQLAAVEAARDAAKAALDRAKLDLVRTRLAVPFDALVKERHVDLGAQAGSTTRVATLHATDEYWIELAVPVDRLRWFVAPRTGSGGGAPARIHDEAAWGPGVGRRGSVLRVTGDIESEGRMARVLVSVPDPLAREAENRGQPRLLLGAYVRVSIDGRAIPEAIALDRRLLRDGDRVWVMSDEGLLEVREVEVAFRGKDSVYVTQGLEAGERVVVSDLSSPVEGMALRTAEDEPEAEAEETQATEAVDER